MGRVAVLGADVEGDRIVRLAVRLGSLPRRVIDRDTAIAWARDGHSFVPGEGARSLALVHVGEDDEAFLRDDHEAVAADSLPALPTV